MLQVGDIAPDFTLPDQNGEMVTLSKLLGRRDTVTSPAANTVKTVVLFFYPKADTPGCTTEACSFRDAHAEFDAAEVVLLGISPDSVNAQQKFAAKYGLPMRLLADADHAVAEKYGVWAEKSMYGRKYMGVARTTFVIGPDGRIHRIFHDVKVNGHANEVLLAVTETANQ